MKKLIALLAVIGFVPTAYAATAGDITWNGEYRLLYTNNSNPDFNEDAVDADSDQSWNQRTRLGLTARAGEKVTFNGTFVHNTQFGANADQVPGGDKQGGAGADANEQNSIVVNEANFSWMAKEDLMIRAGRGSATFANGLVISANDWNPVSKAFDGVLAAWMHEKVDVKGFGVWGATGDDYNDIGRFFGVAADFKALPAFLKTAHVHYIVVKRDEGDYTINGDAGTAPKEDTTRLGVTLAGDAAGVDYSLTYAMYSGETENAGTSTDIEASLMDLEVGYKVPAAMNARFHVGYHTDSGDDSGADNKRYDGFHYDTHNNAGLMDVLAWGNLTYMRLGASFKPSDDITVAAEYFQFTQTEQDDATKSVAQLGTVAGTDLDGEDDLGTELDLSVTKSYSDNFFTTASYRMFTPGDEFGADGDDYNQIYIEGKLKF